MEITIRRMKGLPPSASVELDRQAQGRGQAARFPHSSLAVASMGLSLLSPFGDSSHPVNNERSRLAPGDAGGAKPSAFWEQQPD